MVSARREPHRIGGIAQEGQARSLGLRHLFEGRAVRGGIGAHVRQSERRVARGLDVARPGDARGDLGTAFGRRRQDQVGGAHRRDFDVQIDAVHQRSGNARLVVRGAARVGPAVAGEPRLVGASAAAGIHGGDQHQARRIGHAVIGARDQHFAGLDRLAQRIEHVRLELRELVQEQYAVVRERDFARLGAQTAADQRRHAGGMVRAAERAAARQRAFGDLAGDRGDHRYFEQLLRR